MITIKDLVKMIAAGTEYKKLDDNGKAYGCMMPVYLLYPDIPKYDWPPDGDFSKYVIDLLKKHGHQIALEEIEPGDVVAFRMPFDFIHVGIYIGSDEIVHCMTDETMEKFRLAFVNRRIEGVFRWEHRSGEQYGKL